jgi:hypothetical protein
MLATGARAAAGCVPTPVVAACSRGTPRPLRPCSQSGGIEGRGGCGDRHLPDGQRRFGALVMVAVRPVGGSLAWFRPDEQTLKMVLVLPQPA